MTRQPFASPSVLVAGSINTDLVARVARAPAAGETVTGSSFARFGGGKGANQAIAAARSGAATAMLGALGDDEFGQQRRADLAAEGVDTESVLTRPDTSSGVALIVVEEVSGQNRIAFVPGATATVSPADARSAAERIRPAVVLATLELPADALAALFDASREIGARVILNATPEAAGAHPFLDRVDVLIVNESEAEDLSGAPVAPGGGPAAAAALAALGPETVIVTLGPAGAVVAHAGATATLPATRVKVVDTTGAGDAFCGAFAAALARGSDPSEAAATGVAAGTLSTTIPGAYPSMPSREAIARFQASDSVQRR